MKLSPALKRELNAKGAFTLAVEAMAFIGLLAVVCVAAVMVGAIL